MTERNKCSALIKFTTKRLAEKALNKGRKVYARDITKKNRIKTIFYSRCSRNVSNNTEHFCGKHKKVLREDKLTVDDIINLREIITVDDIFNKVVSKKSDELNILLDSSSDDECNIIETMEGLNSKDISNKTKYNNLLDMNKKDEFIEIFIQKRFSTKRKIERDLIKLRGSKYILENKDIKDIDNNNIGVLYNVNNKDAPFVIDELYYIPSQKIKYANKDYYLCNLSKRLYEDKNHIGWYIDNHIIKKK